MVIPTSSSFCCQIMITQLKNDSVYLVPVYKCKGEKSGCDALADIIFTHLSETQLHVGEKVNNLYKLHINYNILYFFCYQGYGDIERLPFLCKGFHTSKNL